MRADGRRCKLVVALAVLAWGGLGCAAVSPVLVEESRFGVMEAAEARLAVLPFYPSAKLSRSVQPGGAAAWEAAALVTRFVTEAVASRRVMVIPESDVQLATASQAIIIGFNVRPDNRARELAEKEHIDIRTYAVIYHAIDDVKKAMAGLLSPKFKEVYLGRAEVLKTFNITKVGTIAGCKVADGKLLRNAQIRLLRDNVVVHDGKLNSLKRFKDDAREVLVGYECGMGIEGYNDIKVGDVIEAYQLEQIEAKI